MLDTAIAGGRGNDPALQTGVPLHLLLRQATADDHTAVDAAFSIWNLSERPGYVRFLRAHARVLPLAERLLDARGLVQGWCGRTSALLGDLSMLGIAPPKPIEFVLPEGEAARWGALYVVEGSRLGGKMLSRSVPLDVPSAYLALGHRNGGWAKIQQAIDKANRDVAWRREVFAGAHATFAAYLAAAQAEAAHA